MDMPAGESDAFGALLASAIGVDDPRDMQVNAMSAGWLTSSVSISELFKLVMTSAEVHGLGTEYENEDYELVEAGATCTQEGGEGLPFAGHHG